MVARSVFTLLTAVALAVACNASAPQAEPKPAPTPTDIAATPSPSRTAKASATPTDLPSPTFGPFGATQEARVVRVVDGDTIQVEIGGSLYKLRYIGIDTPETVDPRSPVQWMGPEASAANSALVAGRTVYLERDVSETDRFGRLLRYVWLKEPGGWLMVNLELVKLGFAASSTYPPDVRYQDLFVAAQREAAAAGLGLWGPRPTSLDSPAPGQTAGASAQPLTAADCDPSYPSVCIPPPPPDLDCGDITYRRFVVLEPDPHRFDGDHDGIGCES